MDGPGGAERGGEGRQLRLRRRLAAAFSAGNSSPKSASFQAYNSMRSIDFKGINSKRGVSLVCFKLVGIGASDLVGGRQRLLCVNSQGKI